VVTAVGGLTDHVEDGSDGILVPPGSDDFLVDALERIVGSQDLRNRLAVESAAHAGDVDAGRAIGVVERKYLDLLGGR